MRHIRGVEVLSRRERQIAECYLAGATYRGIAEGLCISPATVRTHLRTIYRKLGVSSKLTLLRRLEEAEPPERGAIPQAGTAFVFVAPLEAMSPEDAAIGADLVTEVRCYLGRPAGLVVTFQPAAAHYRLDGSVRSGAGAVRLHARLVSCRNGAQLWAERMDFRFPPGLQAIDSCAARIVSAIRRCTAASLDEAGK